MKIVNKEEQAAQQRAIVTGGAKGFVTASAVALPASYLLHKRWSYYRALPPSLKALGVIIVVVPSFVISAEHAGQKFERDHWSGVGKQELDAIKARQDERWSSLTLSQKFADVAQRHEYGLILSGWAASLAGSLGIIMRNKYQTMPQKVVQARMWAQGLTIGVLIAAGVMTHARRAREIDEGPIRHLAADHSWKDFVANEEQMQAQARQKAIAKFKPDANT